MYLYAWPMCDLSLISLLNEQWPCNVWLCFVTKTNFYITLSRVFLQSQLWIVNYYVKSSSNNLSNKNTCSVPDPWTHSCPRSGYSFDLPILCLHNISQLMSADAHPYPSLLTDSVKYRTLSWSHLCLIILSALILRPAKLLKFLHWGWFSPYFMA